MSKVLLILAHPDFKNSVGNKTIVNTVNNNNNVTVRDLTALYPNFDIDIVAEQKALVACDLIILQYPIYWYNMPPILKQWFDKVLTHGFAFGDGAQLTGKTIMASVTTGSPESAYPKGEMERILLPIRATANFCKMIYMKPVASFGIYSSPNQDEASRASVLAAAQTHADTLNTLINNYKS